MKKWVADLILGPGTNNLRTVRPAILRQKTILRTIWQNETSITFGVERIFRLILAVTAFAFPGLYIRQVGGSNGFLRRRLYLEGYVVFKLALPVVLLSLHYDCLIPFGLIVMYLGTETVHYTLNLIFLSDVYKPPFSTKRSFLMTFINYVELTFDFAFLYSSLHALDVGGRLNVVYFSFVSALTVGFGDIKPVTPSGKILVIVQCLCTLVIVTLAFTRLVAGFDTIAVRKTGPQGNRDPSVQENDLT